MWRRGASFQCAVRLTNGRIHFAQRDAVLLGDAGAVVVFRGKHTRPTVALSLGMMHQAAMSVHTKILA